MKRLASLDILRGLDLFLLVFLQPILWDLLTRIATPGPAAVLYHFDHHNCLFSFADSIKVSSFSN